MTNRHGPATRITTRNVTAATQLPPATARGSDQRDAQTASSPPVPQSTGRLLLVDAGPDASVVDALRSAWTTGHLRGRLVVDVDCASPPGVGVTDVGDAGEADPALDTRVRRRPGGATAAAISRSSARSNRSEQQKFASATVSTSSAADGSRRRSRTSRQSNTTDKPGPAASRTRSAPDAATAAATGAPSAGRRSRPEPP